MEELLKLLAQGFDLTRGAWSLGALAVAGVFVKLVIDFAKTQLGQKLLTKATAKHAWLRPVIAVVLGFLAGALSALAIKQPWMAVLQAGGAGIMAGLATVGGHELLTNTSKQGKATASVASLIANALKAPDAEVQAHVDTIKTELDKAVALPKVAYRLAAMAAIANKNPPKPIKLDG